MKILTEMVRFLSLGLYLRRRGLCRTRSAPPQFTAARHYAIPMLVSAGLLAASGDLLAQHFDVALPWSAAAGEHVTFNEHGLIEYRYDFERLEVTRRIYRTIADSEVSYRVQDQPGDTREYSFRFMAPRSDVTLRFRSIQTATPPIGTSFTCEIWRQVSPEIWYRILTKEGNPVGTPIRLWEVRREPDGGLGMYEITGFGLVLQEHDRDRFEQLFAAVESLDWRGIGENDLRYYGEAWQERTLRDGLNWVVNNPHITLGHLYGGLLLEADMPLDHGMYGFTLSSTREAAVPLRNEDYGTRSMSNPVTSQTAGRTFYDPSQLRRELHSHKAEVRQVIAAQAYDGHTDPGVFILPLMDEEYTDLLRQLFFHVGNYHYYDDHALAVEFFHYSLFFSLQPEHRFALDLSELLIDAALPMHSPGRVQSPYLHDNRALHSLMRPDPVLPLRAAYAAYNIGCLLSLQEDPAAIDWLIVSRYLGFPNYASHAAADPDLAFVRRQFAAQFEAISTTVFDQDANLPQYRDLPLGIAP